MRTATDRLRQAISFELLGLALVTPLGVWAFAMPVTAIGTVALVGASLATAWNYVYNLLFDHALRRWTGRSVKTLRLRILHALLFEAGLLMLLLPFLAWYLGVTLWQALVMDFAFALFYMVYAFGFTWAYDRLFPVAETDARPNRAAAVTA